MKNAWRILFAIGIAVFFIGAGSDYLLPSTSPGLNLPQILIIVAGLALALGSLRLRGGGSLDVSGAIALKATLITIGTLILLELALNGLGRPTYYLRRLPERTVKEIPWGFCDELGCRKRYEAVLDACANGYLSGIRCVINRDGFGDSDEFVIAEDFEQRFRVLVMGDSYTRGFYADLGMSYVDRLEDEMPDAVVWNVAEPGTATSQAVLSFAGIAPRLKPQLSILGFYMNDFLENLVPKEMSLRLIDDEGKQYFVWRYDEDRWGNPVELPEDFVNAYLAAGSTPPASEFERLLGLTHLGTLVLMTMDYLASIDEEDLSFDRQKRATREYLVQLRDQAAAIESELLSLLIPRISDLDEPGDEYLTAVELFEELRIPYLEARHVLERGDYSDHWNNSGHQKVGALLAECVETYRVTGAFADCQHVVAP